MCVLAGGVFNLTGMMAEVSGADLVAVLVCLAKLERPAALRRDEFGSGQCRMPVEYLHHEDCFHLADYPRHSLNGGFLRFRFSDATRPVRRVLFFPVFRPRQETDMSHHDLQHVIEAADKAIMAEDFDSLMEFYDEQATLVIRPGLNASGKEQIRKAFLAIANHFNHSLRISQDRMVVVEGADMALVLAEAVLDVAGPDGEPISLNRRATYVFRKDVEGKWLCTIDNSYGTDLLEVR